METEDLHHYALHSKVTSRHPTTSTSLQSYTSAAPASCCYSCLLLMLLAAALTAAAAAARDYYCRLPLLILLPACCSCCCCCCCYFSYFCPDEAQTLVAACPISTPFVLSLSTYQKARSRTFFSFFSIRQNLDFRRRQNLTQESAPPYLSPFYYALAPGAKTSGDGTPYTKTSILSQKRRWRAQARPSTDMVGWECVHARCCSAPGHAQAEACRMAVY